MLPLMIVLMVVGVVAAVAPLLVTIAKTSRTTGAGTLTRFERTEAGAELGDRVAA